MSKSSKTEKIRLNVDLDKEKHKKLKLKLIKNDKTITDFLNECVENYLNEK